MDKRKLQALLNIADAGSFSRAAEGMECTQSALSHMVKGMEEELGFALLVRGHGGARLTRGGEQLMPYVRALLTAYDQFDAEISKIHAHEEITLRIGSYSSIIMHWIPSILQAFKRTHPTVNVEIRDGSVEEVYRWLIEEQSVDLIFASKQPNMRIHWIPLKNDPLLAILPRDYPIAPGEAFPISRFNGQQFLMPYFGFYNDINRIFAQHRVKPNIMSTSINDEAIVALVEHGFGISMLSELILEGKQNEVKAVRLSPACSRKLGMATRQGAAPDQNVQDFIDCALEMMKKQTEV